MPHDEARPLLSLCMIVKNEAEYLETCLKLARPYVDEIVVIDTGSTDGTQDIARRYADVFEEIEWPNSFAAARNYSLDRASGQYILILDGDEYIADFNGWKTLRLVLQEQQVAGIRLQIRNLLPSNGFVQADIAFQERIFPNDTSIRYTGRVHNQIWYAIEAYHKRTGYPILNIPVEVVHFGYVHAKEKMYKKYEPRIPLLLQEYEEAKSEVHRAYYGYQLAATYYVLERYEDALKIFETLDYNTLARGNIQNAFYAYMLAAQTALQLKRGDKALRFCEGMLSITKKEPAAYFLTGMALLMEDQIENGVLFISEAFEINEKNTQARFPINERVVLSVLKDIAERMRLHTIVAELDELQRARSFSVEVFRATLQRLRTLMVLAEQKRTAA